LFNAGRQKAGDRKTGKRVAHRERRGRDLI